MPQVTSDSLDEVVRLARAHRGRPCVYIFGPETEDHQPGPYRFIGLLPLKDNAYLAVVEEDGGLTSLSTIGSQLASLLGRFPAEGGFDLAVVLHAPADPLHPEALDRDACDEFVRRCFSRVAWVRDVSLPGEPKSAERSPTNSQATASVTGFQVMARSLGMLVAIGGLIVAIYTLLPD